MAYANKGSLDLQDIHTEIKRLAAYVDTQQAADLAAYVALTGNQTVAGVKTFSSMFRIPYNGAIAGAGTVQGDAAALGEGINVGTGANGTVGWRLPTAVAGAIVIFKGTTAGVAKIYPATGGAINALAADAAISLASGAIPAIFVAISATQWYTIPLVPS